MTTPVTITKELMIQLRQQINIALGAICADLPGITAMLESGKYNSTSGTFKLLVVAKPSDAPATADATRIKAAQDFKLRAGLMGMHPEWLGRTVRGAGGSDFRIVGLLPKRTKYPVLCEPIGGGACKLFTTTCVASQLKKG